MAQVTLPFTLVGGQPEDVNQLNSNLNALVAGTNSIDASQLVNGAVTGDKLVTTVAQQLGLSNAANVGRGASIIATTESRTGVAYGTMPTSDQVTGVVLPTNGLIAVLYQATWQSSVANAGSAALFLGANQVKFSGSAATPAVQSTATTGVAAATDALLTTFGGGLVNAAGTGGYTGDVTTGQIIGAGTGGVVAPNTAHLSPGPVYIFAAAGTYDVSVRFGATSGSVTVKNRKLWVWTIGF